MRTEICNLWNKIDASEDVLAVHKRLYEEFLFPCAAQIRSRVQRELNFGFFPEGCAGDCEGPATRSPNFEGTMEETGKGLRDAMSWIKSTIPLYYGEPCGEYPELPSHTRLLNSILIFRIRSKLYELEA